MEKKCVNMGMDMNTNIQGTNTHPTIPTTTCMNTTSTGQPLTKEKELETLEHWKKGMQDKLTEIEHRIEELKQEA